MIRDVYSLIRQAVRGWRHDSSSCLLLLFLALLASAGAGAAAPTLVFNVREYGAAGDGKTLDTAAINKAIDACTAAGGGQVIFPAGNYLSGTVLLKSNVTLNLESGAALVGTPDLGQYREFSAQGAAPEARFGGKWNRALVLGIDVENVTIRGGGTIDGNKVFDPTGEERMRGPHAIILGRCRNVTVRDVTVKDAANYALMIELSDDCTVRGVTFTGGWDGVHFRGWKERPCHNLSITGCRFFTGDDSIAGRYAENVLVQDCAINSSCNGMRIIGPLKNLVVNNSNFFGPGQNPHRTSNRTNMLSGIILQPGAWDACEGALEEVSITSITMKNVASPVGVWLKRPGNTADRIVVSGLSATGVERAAFSVESWSATPVGAVTFRNLDIEYTGGGTAGQAGLVPRAPGVDARVLPAWGFYARNAGKIVLENVRLRCAKDDLRPVIKAEGVGQLDLVGVSYPRVAGVKDAVEATSGTRMNVRESRPSSGAGSVKESR